MGSCQAVADAQYMDGTLHLSCCCHSSEQKNLAFSFVPLPCQGSSVKVDREYHVPDASPVSSCLASSRPPPLAIYAGTPSPSLDPGMSSRRVFAFLSLSSSKRPIGSCHGFVSLTLPRLVCILSWASSSTATTTLLCQRDSPVPVVLFDFSRCPRTRAGSYRPRAKPSRLEKARISPLQPLDVHDTAVPFLGLHHPLSSRFPPDWAPPRPCC